jgi:hypothetical protein
LRLEHLPQGVTLQLYRLPHDGGDLGTPLFSSPGRWLHPLFELGDFLAAHRASGGGFAFEGGITAAASDLFLRDRVIGTAAAFLILRLGLGEVESDIASRRALLLLREKGVDVEAPTIVEAIGCFTEQLLKDESDPEAAYRLLSERRAQALARMTKVSGSSAS